LLADGTTVYVPSNNGNGIHNGERNGIHNGNGNHLNKSRAGIEH